MIFSLFCLIAYVAGSLNFSIIVLKLKTKTDPRTLFSKNAGATNIYRILGEKWAALVLVCDVGKAWIVPAVASLFLPISSLLWIFFFLLLGNRFPCFHGFKGGKGVAHAIGFSLFLTPFYTGISLVGWCAGYLIFRHAFAGSIVLAAVLGLGLIRMPGAGIAGRLAVVLCLMFIVLNHQQNFAALEYRKHRTDA
jgi:glycerol-3-phosphate acyltransferase PlsY